MSEYEFIQDGITYIPSKVIAKSVDLTPDYISRMCREGLVQATWHRGMWYVNEKSLATVLAERRAKQEELARLQSETLKRELSAAQAQAAAVIITEAPLIPRWTATSTNALSSRALPTLALSIFTILILATSVFALPQSTREKITAQLPFHPSSALENFSAQHLTNTGTQLAAAATSFPNYIKEKIQSVFCWWLECEGPIVEVAEQHPRPSTQTNTRTNSQSATSTAQTYPATDFTNVKSPELTSTSKARSATASELAVSSNLPPQTVINQPIIERVVETVRTVVSGGIDETFLDARLAALNTDLTNRMTSLASVSSSQTTTVYNTVSQALRIEELTDLILHSPIIDGGSIAGTTISGTLSNTITSALATIISLTSTELIATNATTTNATTTNLYVSGTATIGSGTGVLQSTSGVVSSLSNGTAGQVLKIVGVTPTWSTDLTGSGSGAGAWATTSNDLAIYPTDPTDVVLVGSNATTSTGNILEVAGASLLRGTLSAYNTVTAPLFNATSTSATSTFPRLSITSSLGFGSDYVTDITGTGLTLSSGALTLDTSGNWTGTFDGLEGSVYLANAFATTSADYWQTQRNFFSTTSADTWKTERNFFATSSADYWKTTTNFFSTTSADYWETQQTARTADDLTNNSIEDLSDVAAMTENYGDLLFWNGSSWADIATTSLGLPTSATLASYLALSDWFATTTDGLDEGTANRYYTDGRVQTYLSGVEKGFFFSTTSSDHWQSQRNFFSTTSSDYWKVTRDFFSTTSATYFSSLGLGFSTTSSDYWETQQAPRGSGFSTTSADYWKTARDFFSTTSAAYFSSLGLGFSTTSAQYFVHSSTTIPKTYTANTFNALQTFGNASSTLISSVYASTTNLYGAGLALCQGGNVLTYDGAGRFGCAADQTATGQANDFFFATNYSQTAAATTSPLWAQSGLFASSTSHFVDFDARFATMSGATTTNLALTGIPSALLSTNAFGSVLATTSLASSFFTNIDKGFFFSTTSANAWSALGLGFSTTSADAWKTERNFFSTTSATYFSSLGLAFSTTSSSYFLSQNQGAAFSTTSAIYFAHSSTTLPKSYTANTFTALQTFGNILLTGSSTLQNVTAVDSTTTNATTTTAFSSFLAATNATTTFLFSTLASSTNLFSTRFVTGNATTGNATSTSFFATTASSTNLSTSNFTLANLTGFLKATAGAVATSLINLASDITGLLPVTNGGTGWASIESAAIPYGNGASALATTSAGTSGQVLALLNGVPTWAATSTLSTISGTLGVSQGGTSATSFSYGLVLSPGGTTALTNIATSSLGLLTTNVAEGSNLYYLDSRVQSFIHGSTTIPKTYTSNTFTNTNTFSGDTTLSNATTSFLFVKSGFSSNSASFGGTATSTFGTNGALTLAGSLNGPLHANAGIIGATTSIGVLYGGTGLSSAPSYGQLLLGNSSGGYSLTATSSLGLPTFGYLFPANATSTVLDFNGGLTAHASSTIGAGGQATGLTIFGGATTTGALIVTGTSASSTFAGNLEVLGALKVGTGSIYLNGSATSTFSAGIQSSALNITSTSASSTFANGIRLSGGCFQMVDGTCAGSGGGSGTINSGTTGQFPYYAANGTTLTATSSIFLATSGNVGVGSTSPNWKLQVAGTRPSLAISDTSAGADLKHWLFSSQGGNLYIGTTTDAYATSTPPLLTLMGSNGGGIGVGTTSPFSLFGVHQSGNAAEFIGTFTGGLVSGSYRYTALAVGQYPNVGTAANIGYMTHQSDTNQSGVYLTNYGDAEGTSGIFIKKGGNVGIGTTSPQGLLHLYASGGTTYLNIDADTTQASALTFRKGSSEKWAEYVPASSNDLRFYSSVVGDMMTLQNSTGNVGIGTTTPGRALDVIGAGLFGSTPTGAGILLQTNGSVGEISGINHANNVYNALQFSTGGAPSLYLATNSNVGIGTTTPNAALQVFASSIYNSGGTYGLKISNPTVATKHLGFGYDNNLDAGFIEASQDGISTKNILLNPNGSAKIGIGTTSPWRTLSVTGTVGFTSSLSAESGSDEVLCIDPTTFEMTRGGANCAASSLRYKENIQDLDYGLDNVLAMRPVSFQWTLAERPNDRSRQVGFIAEEMVGVVPEVVEMNASGTPEGIDYDKLTSILARAIQQIAIITGTFKSNLIQWLGSVANGIQDLFARRLCLTNDAGNTTCVNQEQLAALLSQSPTPPLANPSPPETPTVHESANPMHEFAKTSDPTVHESANSTPTPTHESATSSPQATLLIEEPATSPDSPPPEPEVSPAPDPASDNPPPPDAGTGL